MIIRNVGFLLLLFAFAILRLKINWCDVTFWQILNHQRFYNTQRVSNVAIPNRSLDNLLFMPLVHMHASDHQMATINGVWQIQSISSDLISFWKQSKLYFQLGITLYVYQILVLDFKFVD